MKLSDFDYNLPKGLIAQYPSDKRDESKLLVLHRATGKIEHRIFRDILEYFNKGDLLLLNNTKVIPARLIGKKETGGKVEALILPAQGFYRLGSAPLGTAKAERNEHECLLKPARGCRVGSRLVFGDGELKAEITKIENGRRFLKFKCNGDFENLLYKFGKMPLPPYIKRDYVDSDKDRYQTVYAEKEGAVAAPTAGLHFTKDILTKISDNGIGIERVTLHVGYGTFKPVKIEDVKKHRMEKEYFEAEGVVMEKIRRAEGRVVAVGTTTCRVLESISLSLVEVGLGQGNGQGCTDLFIYPPYKFKVTDMLITNFHLPRTTLLMLVSAFCGRELLMKAYKEAIGEGYRFYSYGDAMLII